MIILENYRLAKSKKNLHEKVFRYASIVCLQTLIAMSNVGFILESLSGQ